MTSLEGFLDGGLVGFNCGLDPSELLGQILGAGVHLNDGGSSAGEPVAWQSPFRCIGLNLPEAGNDPVLQHVGPDLVLAG